MHSFIRKPTPDQFIKITSIAVFIVILAGLSLFQYLLDMNGSFLVNLSLSLFIAVICYALLTFMLTHYLENRIKLIYKNIFTSKDVDDHLDTDDFFATNILDVVEEEVNAWAKQQKKEITDLKLLESYRKKFIGNVFHELRTPIFNIQGYLQTLQEGGIDDSSINDLYLRRASKNAERMNTIVNDLETLAKMESVDFTLEMTTFNIKELAFEVMEALQLQAKKKNITLRFKKMSNESHDVIGNQDAMYNVFSNLISNSIKYGKEKGTTKIGFHEIEDLVVVEVVDNGRGISEQHLPHIFDRFYRVDKSRSRQDGGTGIGLAIVKHIVEAHGQQIRVRSTLGAGTTFTFSMSKSK